VNGKEPRWRTVLNWSAVISFFTIPLVIFTLHVISDEVPWLHFEQHLQEYKYLSVFFQSVTALVFGLAGLHSFDRTMDKKFENGDKKMR